MSYDVYRYIFYGAAILSIVMLFVAVFLFFFFRIPTVIGDLTGSNARKAIENIRNSNEQSGRTVHKTSTLNLERGKLTDKMTPSGRIAKSATFTKEIAISPGTQKISQDSLHVYSEETVVLSSDETTVLQPDETMVLSEETTVLDQGVMLPTFAIEYEITYIHTSEII